MLIKPKDHLVGLDIGSSFIKAAELKKTGKDLILKKFGFTQITPGSIVDGRIQDMEELAQSIKKLFKKSKIKEKNVAIATGGYSVVIKTINTTKASEAELQEQIFAEAEQYIPYDIEDVNIDFQILGESEFSPEQMNVLLVAVRKELVAEYIELINMAGLNPCIIEVDTFALQNIFERLPGIEEEKITMLVDVGVSKTSLNILKGTTSLMMRDNPSGTAQIRDEIVEETGISDEEAESAIVDPATEVISREKLKEISTGIVDRWCADIYGMMKTYRSNLNEGNIEQVLLSGGGAFIEGFPEALASELNTSVSLMDPFEAVLVDSKKVPESVVRQNAPLASIALGLALRRVDDK